MAALLGWGARRAQYKNVYYCGTESPEVLVLVEDADGKVEEKQRLKATSNPFNQKHGSPFGIAVEWVELHPSNRMLYAFTSFWSESHGVATSFAIDAATGLLTQVSLEEEPCSTQGYQPCHAAVTPDGSWLAVAHYIAGTVSIFSCAGGCVLSPANLACRVSLPGERPAQLSGFKGPLAHGVQFDPSTSVVAVCNAGGGCICVYGFDKLTGKLAEPAAETECKSVENAVSCWQGILLRKLGARPRHLCFHPRLPKVYVVTEAGNAVTWHSYSSKSGSLGKAEGQVSSVSMVARAWHAFSCLPHLQMAAEIDVTADGKYLLVSNRGIGGRSENSVKVFAIDETTGSLSSIAAGTLDVGGGPRHFALGDAGAMLVAGQQMGKSLVFFKMSKESGMWQEQKRYQASLPIDCVRILKGRL